MGHDGILELWRAVAGDGDLGVRAGRILAAARGRWGLEAVVRCLECDVPLRRNPRGDAPWWCPPCRVARRARKATRVA